METDPFAARVLAWFAANGRKDLPWQQDPTPYRVWVSEIMLQQTQVATVIPYYERFMASFPDLGALARASQDDVLHHWSGLGYYARARNLHATARKLVDDYAGAFPDDFDAVVALPGIGRSTAGAILALARNERHAILDGNVKRVLARFHAVDGWPGNRAVSLRLWALADEHTPRQDVAAYTQAMMDLGATVCTRSGPRCACCPLEADCAAHAAENETRYPGRKPGKEKPFRRTRMLLPQRGNEIWLERRPPSGIWGGLWSFPELDPADVIEDWCERTFAAPPAHVESLPVVMHSFTHFDLEISPLVVRVTSASSTVGERAGGAWYPLDEPARLGLAAPVAGLIEQLKERCADATNR